jgi:hypothetical protein
VVTINGIWVPGGSAAIEPNAPAGGFIQIGTFELAGGGVIGVVLAVGLIYNLNAAINL